MFPYLELFGLVHECYGQTERQTGRMALKAQSNDLLRKWEKCRNYVIINQNRQ